MLMMCRVGRKLALLEMRIVLTLTLWNFELLETPEKLSGYAAVNVLTYQPQQCYIRSKPIRSE